MKEFSLKNLIIQMRIEEETRKHDQKEEEVKPDLKPKENKMKVNNRDLNSQKNSQKSHFRNMVQIMCYNCNKLQQLARNCRNRNRHAA